jgi:hypothetical protein
MRSDLTVEQLVTRLKSTVERNRRLEVEARESAEQAEQALAAIEALTGPLPISGDLPAELARSSRNGSSPRGTAAVLRVVEAEPNRVWKPAEIHRELVGKGWISPEAKHPKAGTDAAISRLLKRGKLRRLGPGQYKVNYTGPEGGED